MVSLQELIAFFEETAPPSLAEEYDNVGLLVEGDGAEIHTLLLSLDTDEAVVREADRVGAELIVSHHPLLFKPVKRLTEADSVQRTLRLLIRKGIGLYALHTNLDSVSGGLCDALLDRIGGFAQERAALLGEGIGRIARLTSPCTLSELCERIKLALGLTRLSVIGSPEDRIETAAVCNGGGGDLIYDAHRLGAQVYISGDFKYHHARFAYENGLNLIHISHYDAEFGFCRLMEGLLGKQFRDRLHVLVSKENPNPWKTL